MDGAASLFRVFDLAFFLPGSVILVGAWQGQLFKNVTVATGGGSAAYTTVIAAIMGLLVTFLGGVLCHMVIRVVTILSWGREKSSTKPQTGFWPAWYTVQLDEGQHALAQYFWYMRATFANLAVAAPVAALLYARSGVTVGLSITGCALFWLLSLDYARSLDNLTKSAPERKQV